MLVKLSPHTAQIYVVISMIIRAVHNGGYDFINHSSEFYIMCEYEGWHIRNLVDGFKVPFIRGFEQKQIKFTVLRLQTVFSSSA